MTALSETFIIAIFAISGWCTGFWLSRHTTEYLRRRALKKLAKQAQELEMGYDD